MSDERLIRIENKIDKLSERFNHMDTTLAAQSKDISHHIKRTDLLESEMKGLQKYVYMGLGISGLLALLAKLLI